jgi:hypothetical protein
MVMRSKPVKKRVLSRMLQGLSPVRIESLVYMGKSNSHMILEKTVTSVQGDRSWRTDLRQPSLDAVFATTSPLRAEVVK